MNRRDSRRCIFIGLFLIGWSIYCEIIGVRGFIVGLALGSGGIILYDGVEGYTKSMELR